MRTHRSLTLSLFLATASAHAGGIGANLGAATSGSLSASTSAISANAGAGLGSSFSAALPGALPSLGVDGAASLGAQFVSPTALPNLGLNGTVGLFGGLGTGLSLPMLSSIVNTGMGAQFVGATAADAGGTAAGTAALGVATLTDLRGETVDDGEAVMSATQGMEAYGDVAADLHGWIPDTSAASAAGVLGVTSGLSAQTQAVMQSATPRPGAVAANVVSEAAGRVQAQPLAVQGAGSGQLVQTAAIGSGVIAGQARGQAAGAVAATMADRASGDAQLQSHAEAVLRSTSPGAVDVSGAMASNMSSNASIEPGSIQAAGSSATQGALSVKR